MNKMLKSLSFNKGPTVFQTLLTMLKGNRRGGVNFFKRSDWTFPAHGSESRNPHDLSKNKKWR